MPHQRHRPLSPHHTVTQVSIGIPDSPYLTLDEGARFCRFDTCQKPAVAFRQWLRRQNVPIVRRGRKLLVERHVLEAVLLSD
jgi:hypothetical protein